MFTVPPAFVHVHALHGEHTTFEFTLDQQKRDTDDWEEYQSRYRSLQHRARNAMMYAIMDLGTFDEIFHVNTFLPTGMQYKSSLTFIPIATFHTRTNTYQVSLERTVQDIFYDQVTHIPPYPSVYVSDRDAEQYWSICIRAYFLGKRTL